tara:strand:- start:178 stop:642 length:465 start_codon:yes stop_codon:yes gene_type:complete
MKELEQLIELPRVPSKLIRIAVEDMEASIRYGVNIDMSNWGVGKNSDEPRKCSVCMAGAVMLQRGLAENIIPDNFIHIGENKDQYNFIDSIRDGKVRLAMSYLSISQPNVNRLFSNNNGWKEVLKDFKLWGEVSNDDFFNQMDELAQDFEDIGL